MASPSNNSGSSWSPGAVRGLPKYKVMVVVKKYARNCTHLQVKVIIKNILELNISVCFEIGYW
jgi:hypothetical protein